MRKLLLLVPVFLFNWPANAAIKCVKLSNNACSSGMISASQSNWTATCGGVSVAGIGLCSSSGKSATDFANAVNLSNTATDNKYCWCRMVSPAVSRWVFYPATNNYVSPTAGACMYNCAAWCGAAMTNSSTMYSTFRMNMFNVLTD